MEALAIDQGEWRNFTVKYDDLHPFHGRLTLTIFGTGDGEQKILFPGRAEIAGRTRNVSSIDLKHLVNLLLARKAWEQRIPERSPVPDESRSHLVIRYANDSTTIWEWYNDLPQNQRLVEIREFMMKVPYETISDPFVNGSRMLASASGSGWIFPLLMVAFVAFPISFWDVVRNALSPQRYLSLARPVLR